MVAGHTAAPVANRAPRETTANATLLCDTDKGALRVDAAGIGAEAAVLFALLQGAPALDAADFVFVA